MTEPPQRIRVTGPPRRAPRRSAPRAREIDAETRLGEIFMGSLLREQLRLALRTLVLLAIGVGSLPFVFHLAPSLTEVTVAGLPLSWLLLGVLVYPYLLLLGWLYVRAAERNEREFAALLDTTDRP